MKKKIILIVLLIIFSNLTISNAYDTYNVHPAINENALVQSNVDNYLKTQLGFASGIKEVFKDKRVTEWIKEGAKLEDETVCRSRNHFHDPLKPWSSAGLNNAAVNTYCLLLGLEKYSVDSSLIWAQKDSLNPFYDNLWAWTKARNFYYKALTSTTKDDREKDFAYTFRALGQVTHLIADSSVPAHVRNDAHVFPITTVFGITLGSKRQTYESWAQKNWWWLNYSGVKVDQSIFSQVISDSSAPIQISALWDLDKYIGSNPNITYAPLIGIAEYTNANFFSEDTIFKNYPHPTYDDTNYHIAFKYPEKVDAEDGRFDNRVYIRKTIGDANTKLAAFSYISYDVIKRGYYQFSPLVLDSQVYKDYASLLIPRAVGYSAGILDYFFRGDIDMVAAESGSGYVMIENRTEEDMNGMFELWYDNAADQRTKMWSGTYSVGKKSSGNNRSGSFVINAPGDAKEPNKYMLVFRGKMGAEEDAVAGKVVSTEKEYIFLVDTTKTAAFEIRHNNNQYQLVPAAKEINVTRYSRPSTLLTVQSHPNKKEHWAALPRTSFNPDGTIKHTTYTASIGNYGGQYEDTWWEWREWYTWKYPQVVRGFPNAYIPQNFDEGSPYVWDGNLINGEWLYKTQGYYTYERLGSYIHGRRPFTVTDNKLVARNISIRKNEPYTYSGNDYTGPFYVQYKDESGRWVRGIDLPYETYRPGQYQQLIEKYTYLAILDMDKTIHIKDEDGEGYKLIAGNSVLHTTPGYKGYNNFACPECSLGCGMQLYGEERAWPEQEGWPLLCSGHGSLGSTNFRIIPSDYDNMHGDDNFIVFFSEEKNSRDIVSLEESFSDFAGCCAFRHTRTFGQDSLTKTYYLSYRYSSAEIQKIKLAEYVMLNDYQNVQLTGNRITGISSQMNVGNIVYTYIMERPQVGADNTVTWKFVKRIIGIINISDNALPIGHRQEFELDFSGVDFAITSLAAIGVTR